MDIQKILNDHNFILTEAAVIESLRRSGDVNLHPHLENALLIYEEAGNRALSKLYQDFINVARKEGVPITICTPTWRANQERISTAHITDDVNGDAVKFLKNLRTDGDPGQKISLSVVLSVVKTTATSPMKGFQNMLQKHSISGKSISLLKQAWIFF